jgi:lysophospholipase L1-like esterase
MQTTIALATAFCAFTAAALFGATSVLGATPTAASFADFDRRATAGEPLSVVFFGGSLTWGANASDPQRTSYRALMADYLLKRYPKSQLVFHDAAIGGTGSKLGMFRLERDVLARKPDLVFLDFTANDDLFSDDPTALDSYESLLREMIGRNIPVVQCIFGFKFNVGPGWHPEKVLRAIAHKKLAQAYGMPVGDAISYVQNKIEAGETTVEQVWPIDGAHPDDPGYELFFEAVRDAYDRAVSEKMVCHVPEKPVFSDAYMARQRMLLVDQPEQAGWTRQRTYRTSLWFDGLSSRWMGDVLVCDSAKGPVEPLTVKFKGTYVALFGEADQNGLGFKATIDGQPVLYQPSKKQPPSEIWNWNTSRFGEGRLFIWRELSHSLSPGEHTLVITPVVNGADKKPGQLRIESVCVAGATQAP